MPDCSTLPPLLLPTPTRLELRAGTGAVPHAEPSFHDDTSLHDEGYRLTIGEARIAIESASPTGRLHANHTLAQLRRQYPDALPTLVIEDAPALQTRGVMLDVSRCRVPTMPALLEQTDLFASLKLNHMQLYIEHAFAYEGHEQVWAGADPITPEELKALDRHAAPLGISLAANQNCFGHMERWLRHPRYAPLAETHDEFDFYGITRRGPFSLCPTDPGSLALVQDLIAQQLACVSSGLVNIGCDETADLGAGRSRGAVREHGKASVYLSYVRRICDFASSLGARPMLWGDIALSSPERVGELSDEAMILAWGYEPDSPFDEWGSTLGAADRPWLACPGTSSWRSVTGRTAERRANLKAAADAALRHNASGMLLTDWGDLGHRQQPAIALLAIAEGAQAAWNPEAPADPRAISLHVFNDRSLGAAAWLAQLGDADFPLRSVSGAADDHGSPRPLRNASALFESLHPSGAPTSLPRDPTKWAETLDRLNELEEGLPANVPERLKAELRLSVNTAQWAAQFAIIERGGALNHTELWSALDKIICEHERLWLTTSRPGGLAESTRHYEQLRARVRG